MNQPLINRKFYSLNNINLIEKYEICRQKSPCYRLHPPPRPPIFPQLTFTNSSSTFHQRTDPYFIILGVFITLISTCLLLFLLIFKFQFYHKLRQRNRPTKDTNTDNRSTSFLTVIPTCNSLTPLTLTTNHSPSLTTTNKLNLNVQQYLHRSINHNHSMNIYEKIRLSSDHCSCTLAHYQQNQLIPCYYTCVSSPSKIVCQNSLLEKLHCNQQCLCHNFFVPIK